MGKGILLTFLVAAGLVLVPMSVSVAEEVATSTDPVVETIPEEPLVEPEVQVESSSFEKTLAPLQSGETIVYDFPTAVWGNSNSAFITGSNAAPYAPSGSTVEDTHGVWNTVTAEVTHWHDTATTRTFTRVDLFLAVAGISGLTPYPLSAGTVEMKIYAADESWNKGALYATSDAVDATTLAEAQTGMVCFGDGTSGNPFSDECITTFSFGTGVTLQSGQYYVFEITARDVVSSVFTANETYYYPGLSVLGASVYGTPNGYDGIQDAPANNTGTVYMRLVGPEAPAPGPQVSSVLFLPGIKGSRLYAGSEQVWEPTGFDGNADVSALTLTEGGVSNRTDVYTKPGDVIDTVSGFIDIYGSFMHSMDNLKDDGTIVDWRAASYDWRLSIDDIVNNGAEHDGGIYYAEATSTPYLEQELRRLAASSRTGKVTIVAHSNGGLVTKALLNRLGPDASTLVDTIVFVGVPQSGAPQALGALLYGYKEGLPWWFPFLVSPATSRTFAENAPMGYHLLPSAAYFDAVAGDDSHALVRFTGEHTHEKERAAYGPAIDSVAELAQFTVASEGGREKPNAANTGAGNILNAGLLSYASRIHDTLDAWSPPSGITLYQIAGWGVDTVAGIEYYELCVLSVCVPKYRPTFIEDGDGVVPVPSALMVSEGEGVQRYWVNLNQFNNNQTFEKDHGTILAVDELRTFILGILGGNDTALPEFVVDSQPETVASEKKLRFFLHSPLTLELYDSDGNHTGPNSEGSVDNDIPGVQYGVFGEVQYIIAPAGTTYRIEMHGTGSGTFSLDVQETEAGEVTSATTFANLPATTNTVATLNVTNGIDTLSSLSVDENNDGTTDISLAPEIGGIAPYTAPVSAPATEETNQGAGSSGVEAVSGSVLGTTTAATTFESPTIQAQATQIYRQALKTLSLKEPSQEERFAGTPDALESGHPSQQNKLSTVVDILYNSIRNFLATIINFFEKILSI